MQLPSALRYLPRRAHVFSTAAVVYLLLKLTSWTNRLLSRDDDQSTAAWSAANTRAATRILRMASARRGLWIKCCQYVAARSDALPPEYAAVLSKSLDACPPTPPRLVHRTVVEQLAATDAARDFRARHARDPRIDDVFDDFDPANPIASASIAQVHVARLKQTGERVVLKVQHPGIRPMLLQDLEDLKTLLTWVAGAEPKFDMRPVLDAWIRMVPLETDFLHEMRNHTAVRSALRDGAEQGLSASAYVPRPIPELTSDKLFVMEYIDGCKVTDIDTMEKHGVDRTAIVTEITRSFGNQLFVSKVFSGDQHPGNFLVHRIEHGGEPVLLDFGICVDIEERTRIGFARLILAAMDNDSYSLIQALGDVGVELNRTDPVASLDIIKFLFRSTASPQQSRTEEKAFIKNMEDRKEDIKQNEKDTALANVFTAKPADEEQSGNGKTKRKAKVRSPIDSFPGDLVFFFRSLQMLRGLAAVLNVEHSYLDTLRPFAKHALLSSCPENERVKEPVYRPIVEKGRRAAIASKILQKVFGRLRDMNMMIGMQVAVYKDGKLALNMASGQMGKYNPRPVKPDSVFNSFSSTKGLTAILFASLQDQLDVKYDDLVSKYWPEYAAAGKEGTTVANVLSHSAGLPYSLPEKLPMTRLRDDWQGIIKYLEGAQPAFSPGTKSEYHALTFGWLVAGLISKMTGSPYQEHLKSFAETLGIEKECYCGTMPAELLPDVPESRVAALSSSIFYDLQEGPIAKLIKEANTKRKGESIVESSPKKSGDALQDIADKAGDPAAQTSSIVKDLNLPATGISKAPAYILDVNFFNHPVLRSGFVPSANGHFSARALAKIYGAVANDGVVDGIRVLAPGRAKKMQTKFFDIDFRGNRAWGAGLTLYDAVDKNGNTVPNGAIGHGGIGGSFAFAVPSEKFSMAVTLNKLNAVSLSAAVVIAAVCRAFEVPTPSWYHEFATRAMNAFDGKPEDGFKDESSLMERVLKGDGDTDVMKILVG